MTRVGYTNYTLTNMEKIELRGMSNQLCAPSFTPLCMCLFGEKSSSKARSSRSNLKNIEVDPWYKYWWRALNKVWTNKWTTGGTLIFNSFWVISTLHSVNSLTKPARKRIWGISARWGILLNLSPNFVRNYIFHLYCKLLWIFPHIILLRDALPIFLLRKRSG